MSQGKCKHIEVKMYEKDEICVLMDKLTLNMLDSMEQQIRCKVDIEKRINEGGLLFAKSRYTQGSKTVSCAQLPTEKSAEFRALVKVKEIPANSVRGTEYHLVRDAVDKNAGLIDPIMWFGVLVPRSLQFAKERFQKALEVVIECGNIQREISSIIYNLTKLREIKTTL